jgi:hypothetical protein
MRTIKEIKQDITTKQVELSKSENYVKYQNYILSATIRKNELTSELTFVEDVSHKNYMMGVNNHVSTDFITRHLERDITELKDKIKRCDNDIVKYNKEIETDVQLNGEINSLKKELYEVELQIKQIHGETLFKCNEVSPEIATVTFYKDPNKTDDYFIESKVSLRVLFPDYSLRIPVLIRITDIIEESNNKIKLLVGI